MPEPLAVSTTAWWAIGWVAGAVVVLLVAGLLLATIALVRRIIGQAGDIITGLEGGRANTEPLFDISATNHLLVRVTDGLSDLREARARPPASGEADRGEDRGLVGRLADKLGGGGER